MTEAINAVRAHTPLVQCLTNTVVQQVSANALLAIGASPAMVSLPGEAGDFAAVANGVLVNPGTPSAEQFLAIREAVSSATKAGTPWVLDPVGAGGLKLRSALIDDIAHLHPAAIRGNASEIAALAKIGAGARGVDAQDSVEAVANSAVDLAGELGTIVAVSGERDFIASAQTQVWLTSGHPMITQVIGTGCALGAITAAYLGAARIEGIDPFAAVVAAHAHTGAAGQLAGERTSAPGSFHTAWIDGLYELGAEDILARVEIAQ
ncbi:hydroxyethylthiazole kinase [Corynebacterium sp. LK2510]|uniref:hydroxyethylthiazole kinase n=1 Tax=Corynebacterium sp. LK2510 TaxID=3110472 RepID=UPI0034CEB390